MSPKQKPDYIYLILAGIFITNALLAELIGGKIFQFGPFTMSLGVIAWPIVFVTSDLVNEFFGKRGVRHLSVFTALLIVYMFVIIFVGLNIPAASFSPINDEQFNAVFGQSQWIIVGSLAAFLLSQMVDVFVFWLVRKRTRGRLLWLRATGSTVVSQIIDTWIVLGIAFYLPGALGFVPPEKAMTFAQYMSLCMSNYSIKLILAIAMTPVIYMGHSLVESVLGNAESKRLMNQAAEESLDEP